MALDAEAFVGIRQRFVQYPFDRDTGVDGNRACSGLRHRFSRSVRINFHDDVNVRPPRSARIRCRSSRALSMAAKPRLISSSVSGVMDAKSSWSIAEEPEVLAV